jgi:hypothetical protein
VIPSKEQWKKWSYPSKATVVGVCLGVIAILAIPLGIFFYLYPKNPPIEKPIVVLPDKIDLPSNDPKTFEVKNQDPNRTLYSISVKLRAVFEELDPKEIHLISEREYEFFSEKLTDGRFEHIVKIIGIDAEKKPCIYLFLFQLKNGESKHFKLESLRSKTDTRKPLNLFLSVLGFSTNPTKFTWEQDKIKFSIPIRENAEFVSFAFLVTRPK